MCSRKLCVREKVSLEFIIDLIVFKKGDALTAKELQKVKKVYDIEVKNIEWRTKEHLEKNNQNIEKQIGITSKSVHQIIVDYYANLMKF